MLANSVWFALSNIKGTFAVHAQNAPNISEAFEMVRSKLPRIALEKQFRSLPHMVVGGDFTADPCRSGNRLLHPFH